LRAPLKIRDQLQNYTTHNTTTTTNSVLRRSAHHSATIAEVSSPESTLSMADASSPSPAFVSTSCAITAVTSDNSADKIIRYCMRASPDCVRPTSCFSFGPRAMHLRCLTPQTKHMPCQVTFPIKINKLHFRQNAGLSGRHGIVLCRANPTPVRQDQQDDADQASVTLRNCSGSSPCRLRRL
jgi:hypothetical protein